MKSEQNLAKVDFRIPSRYSAYRVGDDGSVWVTTGGVWERVPEVNSGGYLRVKMIDDDGTQEVWLVHRLVLTCFVGPCPPGMQCRHFPDRDKTNNALENLSWGTPIQNCQDKVIHRQSDRAEIAAKYRGDNLGVIPNIEFYIEETICIMSDKGMIVAKIAKKMKSNHSVVRSILAKHGRAGKRSRASRAVGKSGEVT